VGEYVFYRLNRQAQAEGPGETIACVDDSHAHGVGWGMITDDPGLSGVDIWQGKRKVAQLTRYLKPES